MLYKPYVSSTQDDHLEHFGVLGMKWGVRRFQNADGSLTSKGKERSLKEAQKEIKKRSLSVMIKSNNAAANKINGKWVEDFNEKWAKEFKDYTNWGDSPKYQKYMDAYTDKVYQLMNESLKSNSKSSFTTKVGETYTARFLKENGQMPLWGTQSEWADYDKSKR